MTLPHQGPNPDHVAPTTVASGGEPDNRPTPDDDRVPGPDAPPDPPRRPGARAALPPVVLTLGLLSIAVVGAGFIARFRTGETEHGRILTSQLEFGVWSALIGVSLAIWAAVAATTCRALYARWNPYATRPRRGALIVYGVGAVAFNIVIFVAMFVLNGTSGDAAKEPFPLDGVVWRMSTIVVLGQLAALPSILGLWDVQTRLLDLAARFPQPEGASQAPPGALPQLDQLWKDAMRHLACVSLVISAGVIDTGALRNALLAYGRKAAVPIEFPVSTVLIFGAFMSVVFALVFIPVALQWRALAHRLVESVHQVPEAADLNAEWLERRATLTTFLRLDLSLVQLLAPAAGILAPLATSALSLFLPGS